MRSVDRTVDPGDSMYNPAFPQHYFGAGASALSSIELALSAAGGASPARILDLGCGWGRVMRFLAAAYPEATLTACDLDAAGVKFCVERFGAAPLAASPDPAALAFDEPYDLIWAGSLLTHLDHGLWAGYLSLFERALTTGGVAVFSVHGRYVAQRLSSGISSYGLGRPQVDSVLSAYRGSGFGYADYRAGVPYGISVSSPSWVARAVESTRLRLVHLNERAWDRHHDVVACGTAGGDELLSPSAAGEGASRR